MRTTRRTGPIDKRRGDMATLLEIRTRLVNESGRAELVVDPENANYADAGANAVINDAIRWLTSQRYDLADYSPPGGVALLSADGDTNFWSLYHEALLISAARMHLEIRHRNSQGHADWLKSVMPELDLVYRNVVDAKIKADIVAGTTERRIQA